MKFSIVTVCYNSSATIRDTIDSVLSQRFPDIEYIIVDGASTDATLSIIDEYGDKIDKVISEPDQGIYDALNKGVSAASGDVIGILNSDDLYEDYDVLSSIAAVFERERSVDIVFGDVVFVAPDNLSKVLRYYRNARFRAWKLRFGWMPAHTATFVRRSLYQNYGLYKLGYKIAADYEMFVRWLFVQRLPYCYTDMVVVRMRTGGVSTAGLKSSVLLNREIVKACKENGVYTNLMLVLSKFPFKLLELFRHPEQIAK